MTISEAKELYRRVFQAKERYPSSRLWWADLRDELVGVVNAATDRDAGQLIEWWGCWNKKETADDAARRIRVIWGKMKRRTDVKG